MTILSITITNEFQLKINEEEQLNPTIQFDNNEIYFFKPTQEENTITFLKEWIENPDEYKEYQITYQGQSYSLTAEVLFALMINEIKMKIEKEEIIEEVHIDIPSRDSLIKYRMKNSLRAIGLKNLIFNVFDYNYEKQTDQLVDILKKKESYEKFKSQLERAKELATTEEEKQKLEIDTNKETFTERTQYELATDISGPSRFRTTA